VLRNIFKDNKVSLSESNIPLRVTFVAVCRISGLLLISAFKRIFGVDFGLYSVG